MENIKNFEESMIDLEKIANELENGNLDLENLVSKFEQGMKISKYCNSILENAENKITMILKNEEGNIEEINFKKED